MALVSRMFGSSGVAAHIYELMFWPAVADPDQSIGEKTRLASTSSKAWLETIDDSQR